MRARQCLRRLHRSTERYSQLGTSWNAAGGLVALLLPGKDDILIPRVLLAEQIRELIAELLRLLLAALARGADTVSFPARHAGGRAGCEIQQL